MYEFLRKHIPEGRKRELGSSQAAAPCFLTFAVGITDPSRALASLSRVLSLAGSLCDVSEILNRFSAYSESRNQSEWNSKKGRRRSLEARVTPPKKNKREKKPEFFLVK
jgi:hypothetical protein